MLRKTVLLGSPYIKTMLTITADESATISCSNRFFSPIYISESDKVLTDYVVDETDVRLEFGEEFTVTGTVYVYHTNFNSLDAIGSINYVETTGGRGFVGAGGSGGGSSDFTGLTDTPTGYTGHGGKAVTVKGDESGLEFGTFSNTNIYTDDGSLAGDRLISCNTHSLALESGDNSFIIDNLLVAMRGDVGELSISSVGAVTLDAPAGVKVNGTVGVVGQMLVSNGVGATPTWNTVNTASIYNANGILTENRLFSLDGNELLVDASGLSYLRITSNDIQLSSDDTSGSGQISSVKTNITGRLDLIASTGIHINSSVGTNGQVLTSRGGATPEWANPSSSDSIYTADGSLTGNRIVGLDGNELLIGESWCGLTVNNQIIRLRTNDTGEAIVECNQNGQVRLKATNGLLLDTSTGSVGQVLTSGGSNASPTWETPSGGSVDTLYTANGSLTGDRLITCATHELKFGQTDSFIRLQTTEARLNANGGVGLTADISVNTSGQMIIVADKGLSIDGAYGTAGQVLTSNGVDATPTWSNASGGSSVYTADGTISENRTVSVDDTFTFRIDKTNSYLSLGETSASIGAAANGHYASIVPYSTGTLNMTCSDGLKVDGTVGTSGQALISQGSGTTPVWGTISDSSIYTANGTLTGDRIISLDGNQVWFKYDSNYNTSIASSGFRTVADSEIFQVDDTGLSIETANGLSINSNVGTSGQVLTSQGSGSAPIWTTVSGGSSTLDALTDTNITAPANGQALVWDNTNSEWVNSTVSGSGDMLKSVYDTDDSGVIDNAEKVNNLTVETAVPVGAVFTDTVYTHPTDSGNKHIPSGGASGQVLTWDSDGTAVWGSGGSGGDTTIYITNNPTIDTNPTNKDVIYVNTTTGQAFICTDSTVDNNVWEGQLGTKIHSQVGDVSADIFNDGSTVARYKGDGDLSEMNGRTVDLTGTDITYFTGKHNNAFNITQTTSRMVTPSITCKSFSCWFYIDSSHSKSDDYYYIIDFRPTGTAYCIVKADTHLITYVDGTAYIDGTQVASGGGSSISYDTWHHLYFELSSTTTDNTMTLGDYNGGTNDYQLYGGLDTVTFFNRDLTSSEITQLVNENTTTNITQTDETGVRLNEIQTFTKPQCTSIDTTASTNIIPFDEANNHHFTATADDVTFTGGTVGQQGMIIIDSADNITGWDAKFKFKTTLGALTTTETFAYFIQDLNTIRITRWE